MLKVWLDMLPRLFCYDVKYKNAFSLKKANMTVMHFDSASTKHRAQVTGHCFTAQKVSKYL